GARVGSVQDIVVDDNGEISGSIRVRGSFMRFVREDSIALVKKKMVVTGDHTQIDLPRTSDSSLLVLDKILDNVESIKFVDLATEDVIRHEVVRRIISAFDAYQAKERKQQ
ncbi:MAG TPA: PhoH family protein, partial [Candidatus Rifleibacterium sp.]|nr:PhoH family protein [Candidatus Rifleibacterium sp.]